MRLTAPKLRQQMEHHQRATSYLVQPGFNPAQCSESDACYLFPRISSRASSARRSRAIMSSAVFVHMNGFGLAL